MYFRFIFTKSIVVSGKWKATPAAVKEYRSVGGFTETSFEHEIVCHGDGPRRRAGLANVYKTFVHVF